MEQPRYARAVWIPRVLLALLFVGAAFAKLSGQPMMVAEFQTIGLGQDFRILTGVIELVAVGLLLWPRTSLIGAGLMLCVLVGAFVAQVGPLHGDVIHVIVIAAIVLLTIWLTRRARRQVREFAA